MFQVCVVLVWEAWCLFMAVLLGKQIVFMSERKDHVSGQSLQLGRSNRHPQPHLPKQGASASFDASRLEPHRGVARLQGRGPARVWSMAFPQSGSQVALGCFPSIAQAVGLPPTPTPGSGWALPCAVRTQSSPGGWEGCRAVRELRGKTWSSGALASPLSSGGCLEGNPQKNYETRGCKRRKDPSIPQMCLLS